MSSSLLKFLLHWGQPIAGCVTLVALVCLVLIWRRRSTHAMGCGSFLVAALSAVAIVASAGGLALVRGAMSSDQGKTLLMLEQQLGSAAPPLTFKEVPGGREHALSEHAGKVVLINLWATWCQPCVEEMKHLDRLQAAYPKELVVLALSDEEAAKIEGHLADKRWSFTCGRVEEVAKAPEVIRSMEKLRPVTLVVDRSGVIRDWLTAASYEDFEAAVRKYF